MRVDWAVPCRYAETPGDGTANMLGAGVDSMWLAELPQDVGLYLMLRVAGTEDEFQEEHQLAVRLVDPAGDKVEILSLGFSMPEMPPLKPPGVEAGMLLPVVVCVSR